MPSARPSYARNQAVAAVGAYASAVGVHDGAPEVRLASPLERLRGHRRVAVPPGGNRGQELGGRIRRTPPSWRCSLGLTLCPSLEVPFNASNGVLGSLGNVPAEVVPAASVRVGGSVPPQLSFYGASLRTVRDDDDGVEIGLERAQGYPIWAVSVRLHGPSTFDPHLSLDPAVRRVPVFGVVRDHSGEPSDCEQSDVRAERRAKGRLAVERQRMFMTIDSWRKTGQAQCHARRVRPPAAFSNLSQAQVGACGADRPPGHRR